MATLSIEGVVAGYGQGDVLKGVDLHVPDASITCVIGPNGAGKSTVLKVLSGLLRPREGTVTLDGEVISGRSPREILSCGVVHVPQERSLFPLMSVWDNVLIGGYILQGREAARGTGWRRWPSGSPSSARADGTAPALCPAASRRSWRSRGR